MRKLSLRKLRPEGKGIRSHIPPWKRRFTGGMAISAAARIHLRTFTETVFGDWMGERRPQGKEIGYKKRPWLQPDSDMF
jgi:hypothetical protein